MSSRKSDVSVKAERNGIWVQFPNKPRNPIICGDPAEVIVVLLSLREEGLLIPEQTIARYRRILAEVNSILAKGTAEG